MAFAAAAAVPTVEELTDMVVGLIRQNQVLENKVTALEASAAAGGSSIGGEERSHRQLVDTKKLFPDPLMKDEEFRDWREDFIEWVDNLAPEVAKRLEEVELTEDELEIDEFDEISRRTPLICNLMPSGEYAAAERIPSIGDLIHHSCPTDTCAPIRRVYAPNLS